MVSDRYLVVTTGRKIGGLVKINRFAVAAGEICLMSFTNRLSLCFLTTLVILGCGPGKPPGARSTKKVTAVVLYKGSPVQGATVTFVDQTQSEKPANSNGVTDAEGKAKMKTYVDGDGAVLGSHKVIISKMTAEGGQNVDVDDPKYDPNAPPPTVKYHLPQKFSVITTSGLTAEVTESGPAEFTFDLKD